MKKLDGGWKGREGEGVPLCLGLYRLGSRDLSQPSFFSKISQLDKLVPPRFVSACPFRLLKSSFDC